jgi:beta-lactamase regulating signal transducer with metallopeptidase domain
MSPEWQNTLLRVMLESSLRVCLLAVAVGGILVLARVRSGGVRHAAWSAVLGAMLLMPVLPYYFPTIEVPLPSHARRVEAIPAAIESAWTKPDQPFIEPPGVSTTAAPVAQSPVAAGPAATVAPRVVWPLVVLGIYLAGVLFLLARLLLGWLAVRRIGRDSRCLSSDVRRPASGVIGSGLRTSDSGLYECSFIATPVTIGVFAPKILLPSAWKLWPETKLRAVLAHELAHVRRRDPLIALLARLNLCLFWFHPVAWWLEKQLATTAEHACDDVGLRVMGEKRRYAEVLLDMAEAVRRAGGRLSWDGVGVHGTGLLGQRIDRVLRGELFREVSMTRKVIVALSCAIAIFIVVACRQQLAPPAPLKEEPAFAKQQAENKARIDSVEAARQMNAAQVAEVQASLKNNPEDLAARRKLLTFAVRFGVPVPGEKDKWAPRCAQVIGDKECIELRRTQILWLIEHHPDSDVLGELGQIWPAGGHLNDPAGYEQARKLWLAQSARPDATTAVLSNAAAFFEATDQPLAEKLLLRAQGMDPNPRRSARLGTFYAGVLGGRLAPPQLAAIEPPESYMEQVRRKLEESKDVRLLGGAAFYLAFPPPSLGERRIAGLRALAKACAERAVQIDPQAVQPHTVLVSLRDMDRYVRMRNALGTLRSDQLDDRRLFALPGAERFDFLPRLAANAYSWADYLGWKGDTAGAKATRERARRYADELLRLAPKFRDSERYGTAIYVGNFVLAGLTFQQGDGQKAGNYLIEASKAPVNDDLRYSLPGPGLQMLGYMLRDGIREPVVEFLERVGKFNLLQGKYFLQQAAQVRKGYRPLSYPRETPYYPGIASQ